MWNSNDRGYFCEILPRSFLSSLGNINLSHWVAIDDFCKEATLSHHFPTDLTAKLNIHVLLLSYKINNEEQLILSLYSLTPVYAEQTPKLHLQHSKLLPPITDRGRNA